MNDKNKVITIVNDEINRYKQKFNIDEDNESILKSIVISLRRKKVPDITIYFINNIIKNIKNIKIDSPVFINRRITEFTKILLEILNEQDLGAESYQKIFERIYRINKFAINDIEITNKNLNINKEVDVYYKNNVKIEVVKTSLKNLLAHVERGLHVYKVLDVDKIKSLNDIVTAIVENDDYYRSVKW